MTNTYRYCHHIHDNGDHCGSAALTGRDYCRYHLRYRGRLMRMARARARNQRLAFTLPPLENMHAVQSALTQVVEAVAAGMIDLKLARVILTALRQAAQNFKQEWRDSAYRNEAGGIYDQFESEFGLPENLDINIPPEVAYPPPDLQGVISSEERSDESKDSFVAAYPPAANAATLSPMPTMPYCKDGPGCPEHTIRADFPVTPETVELMDVLETQGSDAFAVRSKQMERNRSRRQLTSDRKRYAALALERNLRVAAEQLAERKLDAERAAAEASGTDWPPKKPSVSAEWEAVFGPNEVKSSA